MPVPVRRYVTLDNPLNPSPVNDGYSKLNDLYPGRPMPLDGSIDRNDIPHEHPKQAQAAFEQRTRETKEYAAGLQRQTQRAGGGDAAKVSGHAAVDPDEMINDPDLRNATMVSPPAFNDTTPVREPPATPGPEFAPTPGPTAGPPSVENFEATDKAPTKKGAANESSNMYIYIVCGILLAVAAIVMYLYFFKQAPEIEF